MDIFDFVCKHDVDFAAYLPSKGLVNQIENTIGVKIGDQLKQYLLEYGYLGFESIEFYGANEKQGLSSDIVKQTIYLHNYYSITNDYIAFENCGVGDYALVDSFDRVYIYQTEDNKLTITNKTLFKYILSRFNSELKYFSKE